MAAVADQQDVVAGLRPGLDLVMNLGDQGTGCVHRLQSPALCVFPHRGRNTVGAEDHRAAGGHFVQLFDEHDSPLREVIHDGTIVDDLTAHIESPLYLFQHGFDDGDRPIHAGAETARTCNQQTPRFSVHIQMRFLL